jgi:Fe2+ transport system protein B
MFSRKEYAMASAKRLHPSAAPHHFSATETAVWVMIVTLLALACFAAVALLRRVGG